MSLTPAPQTSSIPGNFTPVYGNSLTNGEIIIIVLQCVSMLFAFLSKIKKHGFACKMSDCCQITDDVEMQESSNKSS